MQKRRKLTRGERALVHWKCEGHCAYCGVEITVEEMQVDHLIPLHLADQHPGVKLDELGNMMPACRSCNHYKSTRTLDNFRRAVEMWPIVLERDSVTYRNASRFGQVTPNPHPVVFYFERMRGAENGNQADPV